MAFEIQAIDPNKFSIFIESITQEGVDQERIEQLLQSREFETLGRYLWNVSIEYAESFNQRFTTTEKEVK